MKFILGTKLGMTQVFADDGRVVPVTRVQAGPCIVTQVKSQKTDNCSAVQIGYQEQKMFRLNKAQQGHLKGLKSLRILRDVRVEDDNHGLERGDEFTASVFTPGEKIEVTGTSKGKGFQGVVKRHNFKGSLKTHGHKDQHRMPGSIGSTGPARVFKGTRMGGHMGDDQVTVKNLEIVSIDLENNEILVKGAVPGARGSLVLIKNREGNIEIDRTVKEEPAAEEKEQEAPKAEEATPAEAPKTEETPAPAEEQKKEEAAEPAASLDSARDKETKTEEKK